MTLNYMLVPLLLRTSEIMTKPQARKQFCGKKGTRKEREGRKFLKQSYHQLMKNVGTFVAGKNMRLTAAICTTNQAKLFLVTKSLNDKDMSKNLQK